jgi:cell division septal protein FtsQ
MALALLVTQGPKLMRRLDIFRVQRVEVVGTRYLAPHLALEQSGITARSSLFDDPEPWREALLEHPLIDEVTIDRDFPGTLVIKVVEVEPVALVATPVLRPVDAKSRLLPIEPSAEDVDLPIIAIGSEVGEDGRLKNAEAVALVDALDRLRLLAPQISAQVSAVAPLEDGAFRFSLREPARGEALLPADFNALQIEQLRLTLADLGSREEISRVRRVDVRFRDQVVVSLTPS